MCWFAFTSSCSWRPIFPLSCLAAHWATGAGVTVHLNLLYSFIIFWLFHGTIFFLTYGTSSYHSPILSKILNECLSPWNTSQPSKGRNATCAARAFGVATSSVVFIPLSGQQDWREREPDVWGVIEALTPHWLLVLHSLRYTPYLSSTLHSVLVLVHCTPWQPSAQHLHTWNACVSSAPLENTSFFKQGPRPLSRSSTTSDMPYMLWGWLVTGQEIPDRHWSQIPV